MTVEELNVVIRANTIDFQRQIDGVERELNEMRGSVQNTSNSIMGSFKAIAASAAVTTVVKLFSTATTAAGELEQNLGGSEAVFKQYAATLQNTAKEAYSSLGLSESAYLATANKMGALFQGSGFTIQQSADMTAQAMQRAADVASIMGVSVDDAMNAVAGAAKGNFTMMDNLGVAINDTTLKIYAQEKGLGELLTTQDKVNAAMQMFMEKSEYAAGNYMKENSTYAGALTTFKAEMQNFAAEAGTAMLPLATAAIPVLTQVLTAAKPILLGLSTSIGELGQVVTDVSEALQNATPQQQAALKLALGMAVAIPTVTTATKLMTGAKMLYNTALTLLIPKQLTFATALKATMGWIGLIVGALALLGIATNKESGGLGSLVDFESKQSDSAKKTADGNKQLAKSSDEAADSVKNLTEEVKGSLMGFDEINRIGGGDSSLGSSVVTEDDIDALDDYASEIDSLMADIESASPTLGFNFDTTAVKTLFDDVMERVRAGDLSGAWEALWDGLDKIMTDTFGESWVNFSNFWEKVGNKISRGDWLGALELVGKGFDELMTGMLGKSWTDFSSYWQKIGGLIQKGEWGEAIKTICNSVDETLTAFLGKTWTDFRDHQADIINHIKNGEILEAAKLVLTDIEDFCVWYGEGYIGVFENILKGIDSLFGTHIADWYSEVTSFWRDAGGKLYELLHGGKINKLELDNKYGSLDNQIVLKSNEYMRNGMSAEEAQEKALNEVLDTQEKSYYFNTYLAPTMDSIYGSAEERYEQVRNQTPTYDSSAYTATFAPSEYYSATNMKKIHTYASGGFPDYGSIFIANEAGPELVGTIGGRTAVANNSQIETAIYNAVRSAISDGSFGGNNQGGDIHVTVELDGDVVGESVVRYNEKRTKRFNGH